MIANIACTNCSQHFSFTQKELKQYQETITSTQPEDHKNTTHTPVFNYYLQLHDRGGK